MSTPPESAIETALRQAWPRWKSDCGGFVHAVAGDPGIALSGNANAMVDAMDARANGCAKPVPEGR